MLILFVYLLVSLRNSFFPSRFPNKICYIFVMSAIQTLLVSSTHVIKLLVA